MKRNITVVVTDYDIDGSLQIEGLNIFPDLKKSLGELPLCLLYLPEEESGGADNWHYYVTHKQLWNRRADNNCGGFALPDQRPDKIFVWNYQRPKERISIEGLTYWRPQNPRSINDGRKDFFDILQGVHKTQDRMPEPRKVETIVDCTDHPGLVQLLEREGYVVTKIECFKYNWPKR